jgi:O-antigen/teichoic acid export membrane protein
MRHPWSETLRHWRDPLYRQSYYLLASTGVSAVTGLAFWVVAAHRTTPDVLGVAAGLVAATAFLSYLTSFALPYAMLRFGGPDHQISSLVNLGVAFSAATSLVAALLFAVLAPVVAPTLGHQLAGPTDVVLFGLAGVGAGIGVLLDNVLAARHRGGAVLVRNTVAGLARPALVAFAAADDPRPVYLAATMPVLVTAVAVYLLLPKLLPGVTLFAFQADPTARAAASFAAHTMPGSLLSGAPQFALPLIAVGVLAAHEYAYFYTAWSVAQIVYLVPAVISNITLSQSTSGSDHLRRARRFCLLLIAPASAIGILGTGPLLPLYGEAYVDGASTPLRLLLLAAVPWAILMLTKTQLRLEHRFVAVTALTAVFCASSLGLPFLVGSAAGVTGMAAGWLVAVVASGVIGWGLTNPPRSPVVVRGAP